LEKEGFIKTSLSYVGAAAIDKKGIAPAIRKALDASLEKLEKRGLKAKDCDVLLDGALRAPSKYKKQKTIIKGDLKEKVISAASVFAKVSRDRKMVLLGKKLPEYKFEKHKGYGTKAHIKAIKKHGLTKHHRKTFLRRLL